MTIHIENPISLYKSFQKKVEAASNFDKAYQHDDLIVHLIEQKILLSSYVSFDVFDTLLWRDEKSELERFSDIVRNFLKCLEDDNGQHFDISVQNALLSRIFAASNAYRLSTAVQGCIEGRYADIVQNTISYLNLPDECAELWRKCEFEIECQQLRLSSFASSIIDLAKSHGKKVICLSDMYFSAAEIEYLVGQADSDILEKIDAIYSSADFILNKRQGTIYPHLAEMLKAQPSELLHFGDSFHSDYLKACENGWKGLYLPVPKAIQEARISSHDACYKKYFPDTNIKLPMMRPSLT